MNTVSHFVRDDDELLVNPHPSFEVTRLYQEFTAAWHRSGTGPGHPAGADPAGSRSNSPRYRALVLLDRQAETRGFR